MNSDKVHLMLNIDRYVEDVNNRNILFYLKNNVNNYPLGKIFNSLMINSQSILDIFTDDIDKMLLSQSLMMRYHDASIISTIVSFYMPGLVVNGGFTRELARMYSKKVFNNQLYSVNMNNYDLNDLDIHLSSELQLDHELFIKDELITNVLLKNFKKILKLINCKILGKNIKDMLQKSYSIDDNILFYNMYLKIGSKKSSFVNDDIDLNTQFVLSPKGKYVDFICNQICIKNDYSDDYKIDPEIVPINVQTKMKEVKKEHCGYMQKYANIWKSKIEMILKKTEVELPESIINNIIGYLKTDIRQESYNEHRLGCFYIDRESLSRCEFSRTFTIQNIFEQLSMDVTYFIGDCKETGCIGFLEEQSEKYKWDKEWASKNEKIYILKNRINKLEKHGIRILNKCCMNNSNCLWFKRNNNINTKKYLSIFNNI